MCNFPLNQADLISLSDREMTVEDLLYMHNHPKRLCIKCQGTGNHGVVMAITFQGPIVMPVLCDDCGGVGMALYQCYN